MQDFKSSPPIVRAEVLTSFFKLPERELLFKVESLLFEPSNTVESIRVEPLQLLLIVFPLPFNVREIAVSWVEHAIHEISSRDKETLVEGINWDFWLLLNLASVVRVSKLNFKFLMSCVKLSPRPVNTFDFWWPIPFVLNSGYFVALFVEWAILSNFKVSNFVSFPHSFESPLNSCLIIPEKVNSITSWISDPNVMPIILTVVIDVWILLENYLRDFRSCRFRDNWINWIHFGQDPTDGFSIHFSGKNSGVSNPILDLLGQRSHSVFAVDWEKFLRQWRNNFGNSLVSVLLVLTLNVSEPILFRDDIHRLLESIDQLVLVENVDVRHVNVRKDI